MASTEVQTLLEAYGRALSDGDVGAIACCWEVPAFVLSDAGAVRVESMSEVEAFFEKAITSYRAQGLVSTRPEIQKIEQLSDRVVSVDVQWPALDESGTPRSVECSRYVLRADANDKLRIRVVVMRAFTPS